MNEVNNPTEKLKPVFDEVFKYKIGDAVGCRQETEHALSELEINKGRRLPSYRSEITRPPIALIVVARFMEECHGGVQLHYRLQSLTNDGVSTVTMFEYQLCDYAECIAARKALRENYDRNEKGEFD